MPLDALVETLNARLTSRSAAQSLEVLLSAPELGEIALVSSFGAEAAVLLHLVALTKPDLPVLFLDTGQHFTETLVYQQELAERLQLTNLRILSPDSAALAHHDPDGLLHRRDANACCALRKRDPLEAALSAMPNLSALITGRKRYQGGARRDLQVFEYDPARAMIKANPLAHWSAADLRDYMEENRLPQHPLRAKGYLSIGCAPCTSPVNAGEAVRAGRWRGTEKIECGIHFSGGRVARGHAKAKETT